MVPSIEIFKQAVMVMSWLISIHFFMHHWFVGGSSHRVFPDGEVKTNDCVEEGRVQFSVQSMHGSPAPKGSRRNVCRL